ncbi:MAG TPA: four helix bundle protein [Vicinamibacterales bacterium]|nr:four helix bundle protein [Vicinamibacterales bacterium]
MSHIKTFRDLETWQLGMRLVELTYVLTADFPDGERYGLVSQMRRAAVSIPSNVAEGQAMQTGKWSLRYINTALGSSAELDTQLEVSVRLRFVTAEAARECVQLLGSVRRLLYGMRRERLSRLGASVGGASVMLAVLVAMLIR